MTTLQLHIDLRERIAEAIARTHKTVIHSHKNHHDNGCDAQEYYN
jgi:hypothetical protein